MKYAARRILTSRYFYIPVAVLLLYTLLGFVLSPLVIRWYVPKYARANLQCQAVLGAVRINPYLLTFEAKGFDLCQTDGSPLVGFDRLFVDFEMSSLFQWAVVFRELHLEKPVVHMVFDPDGGINLQKLGPRSQDPSETKEPDSKPLRMILQSFAVRGGKISITDRRLSTPAVLGLESLDFSLKDLSTIQEHNGAYMLTANTPEGEKIEWQGNVGLMPLRSSGKLVLTGIRAATLWSFVRDALDIEPPRGDLTLTTTYRLDAGSSPVQMTLEGLRIDLSDFSLKLAHSDGACVELKNLQLDAPSFDLAAKELHVAKLLAEQGSVDVRIDPAGRINLQRIAHDPSQRDKQGEKSSSPGAQLTATPEAASRAAPASPFKVKVDAVEIKSIGVALNDASRAAPVNAGITAIDLKFKAEIEAGVQEPKLLLQNIFSELKAVHIGGSQSPEPLFHTDGLTFQGGEFDLGGRSFTVSRIALGKGHLDVSSDREGRINWVRLFAAKGASPEDSGSRPAARSGSPWKFLVKSFEIDGFRSKFSDVAKLPEKPIFNLQGIKAKITEVDGKSPMGFEVGFQVEQGGSATIRGKVDPSTPSVEAEVDVSGLVLTPLQPYLEPFITLVLQSASVSTRGKLRYGLPGAVSHVGYEGSMNFEKLSLSEPGSKETYLGWDAMRIPQLKFALQPDGLEVNEIILSKLVGELIIAEDRTVNLAKVMKKQDAPMKTSVPAKASPKEGQEGFPFHIGKVRLENGNVVFADLSLRPKFMTRIHDLKGTVGGISSARDTQAKIQLDGRVDQYGMAKINGVLRLYDPKHSTDIDMVFRNVEMTSLTPYSGKFAGRLIKSGKLSMDLKYRIQNNQLVGDNKIIVDNLLLGERVDSPDAVNLPLDLAVALLKDSNGRIDIGLPVSGDLNNPQFKIGPLIWKAFLNLLTRAVTAPFRALGGLFGGEDKKVDTVDFDPGKAELLPPEKEKLKKLADALQKRPQLKLVVQGRFNPEADGMELKELSVCRTIATRLGVRFGPEEDPGLPDFSDSKTRRGLEEVFQERFGKPALSELEEGIQKGTVKPRTPERKAQEKGKHKKAGRFERIMSGLKLYKVIPGVKSPEEAAIFAGEIYVRLVESEPIAEDTLKKLASNRAQAIAEEMKTSVGIPPDRLAVKDPEPSPSDAEPSAKLSLDAL